MTETDPPTPPRGDNAFRADGLRGRRPEMTYGGALSFMRRPYARSAAGADIAVTGVPFDSAVTYRPGARLGPRAVRAASVQLAELDAFPWGWDPFERLSVVDIGDCFIDPHHPLSAPAAIEAHAAAVIAEGARLLSLGGDHFVSYPLLKAHAARHGPLALVQFDAHGDFWPDDGDKIDHGTMFLRAAREGVIDPDRSIQVGIRTANAETGGVEILTAPWVHRNGVDAVIERVGARVGAGPAYLTFDIDCLDPAFAPGTGTPVPGGLASWQALEILRGLGALEIVGADVVEVSPPFDHAEITAQAAATVAHDLICLWADKRGG